MGRSDEPNLSRIIRVISPRNTHHPPGTYFQSAIMMAPQSSLCRGRTHDRSIAHSPMVRRERGGPWDTKPRARSGCKASGKLSKIRRPEPLGGDGRNSKHRAHKPQVRYAHPTGFARRKNRLRCRFVPGSLWVRWPEKWVRFLVSGLCNHQVRWLRCRFSLFAACSRRSSGC